MDIRRTILWMILTFSLLLLWNNWQTYNGKPSMFGPSLTSQTTNAEVQAQQQAQVADASVPTATAAAAPAAVSTVPGDQAPAADAQSREIEVNTDVLRLTFDTLGAQLVRAELPQYTIPPDSDEPFTLLDRRPGYVYVAQTGVVGAPAGQNWPTHLTPFRYVGQEQQGGRTEVRFEAESDGVRVVKIYALTPNTYDILVRHEIHNLGSAPIQPSLYWQLERDGNEPPGGSSFYATFTGPAVYSAEDKYQKIDFSDLDKGRGSYTRNADNGWIGMVQHYFATAWVPAPGIQRHNEALRIGDNLYAIRTLASAGSIAPGQSQSVDAYLWTGPQDQQAMGDLAPGLELVVDYGWLTIIAKPVFKLMTWLHTLLGNWGWTIVALTVLIKLAFYPLSAASYRSMAKMKKFTPRLQALREKYGDDKAKMNQAMMELYRTEKINPLGGCLPMLVQIPVFIALYWVLLGSVEMRGAPWILWIQDLSARDPWFILPAVMMATMFLQIKLNPTPPDPMQARIMMIMPLVFGGMMFFFPAGLVLYWVVNNILSIAQQRFVMYQIDKADAAASR
ncbi:MAG TPA: membrane protein insertase YidC [Burkholderiaceae bacterium]|jgi:YidC/Oxa1 family membrane protein insertase|nr:membrane protein insertase YidC [Burkholderiaceae bacterium]